MAEMGKSSTVRFYEFKLHLIYNERESWRQMFGGIIVQEETRKTESGS
jgi:hypothetical protein